MSGNAENNAGTKWTWTATLKSGPAPTFPPETVTTQPVQAPLTPETLPDYLKKMGFEPRVITPPGGAPYCQILIKENDGWSYDVEVIATKTGGLWLGVALQAVPRIETVPPAKLLALLEANGLVAPSFFVYRPADNRLCMR